MFTLKLYLPNLYHLDLCSLSGFLQFHHSFSLVSGSPSGFLASGSTKGWRRPRLGYIEIEQLLLKILSKNCLWSFCNSLSSPSSLIRRSITIRTWLCTVSVLPESPDTGISVASGRAPCMGRQRPMTRPGPRFPARARTCLLGGQWLRVCRGRLGQWWEVGRGRLETQGPPRSCFWFIYGYCLRNMLWGERRVRIMKEVWWVWSWS